MTNYIEIDLRPRKSGCQSGFTLIEVMISMAILTIGLVSLLGVFAIAMATTQTVQQDMIAKQLAQDAMESIVTARETANVALGTDPWDGINNVGGGGIFVPGFQSIYGAGVDGIIGTADDSADSPVQMRLPGPTGVVTNTAADMIVPLTNFQRQIVFTATASGDLRAVTITIRYTTPQSRVPKTYVLSGMISQYR